MTKYDNIPGFPGYYISKRGGLWSNRKNGQWKKLKPHLNKMWNRYQCTLRDSRGIRKLCKISRLVATVYLPNPENLPIVMHLDNNPANDYYRNLKSKSNMSQVAIIHKESRDNYISGNSYTWCPCCGKCYVLSEEEVVNAIDNDLSVYAECSCGNSFYIETEDE